MERRHTVLPAVLRRLHLNSLRAGIQRMVQSGRHSVKSTILWIFIPIIIIFMVLIGVLSYWIAARQIESNAYTNIMDTVSQTRNFLDNRLSAIFEQLVALEDDSDTLFLLNRLREKEFHPLKSGAYISMNQNLERIYASEYSAMDSILIYFNDGDLNLSKKDYMTSRVDFSFPEWRGRFRGNHSDYYWVTARTNDVFRPLEENGRIASVFKLFGDVDSKVHGVILFNLREDFFKNILRNARISENGVLAIFSPDGLIRSRDVPERYRGESQTRQMLAAREEPTGRFTFTNPAGNRIMVVYDTISINRWRVAAIFPEDDILNRAVFARNIMAVVILFLIIAAVVLSNLLAQILTRPMSQLTDKVREVEAGDLEVPFDVDIPNEIGVLNQGIRGLIQRVKILLGQIRAEQEEKRQAELAVLQSQIKPHFLYNTLDSIRQLIEMGERREASAMVEALAKFFRISISGTNEMIRLAEEIEHVRNYLLILKMRYQDGFDYEIDMAAELLDYKITKLTLQPLVENAIYHGIKEKRSKGVLQIRGYIKGPLIILEVRDNGAGIAETTLERIRTALREGAKDPSLGLGIINVQQRLQIHYGREYGLEIESRLGEGTTIRVKLPLLAGGENDVPVYHH